MAQLSEAALLVHFFGASGSANFLSRSTAVAATIFFCSTLAFDSRCKAHRAPVSGGVLGTISETTAPAPEPIKAPVEKKIANLPAQKSNSALEYGLLDLADVVKLVDTPS